MKLTAALADELQKRTRAWFSHPDRRRLLDLIHSRLDTLTPPAEGDRVLSSPDGHGRAEVITDPATDLQSWQVAGEVIRDVYPSGVAWQPDGFGFYYDRYLPYPGGHGLYFHSVGTPQGEDACILYQPQHPEHYYQPHVSPDGRWLAVSTLNGSACNLFSVRRTVSPTIAVRDTVLESRTVSPTIAVRDTVLESRTVSPTIAVRDTVLESRTNSPTIAVRDTVLESRTNSPTYTELVSRFIGRYDPIHWQDDELICLAVEPNAPNGQLIAFQLNPPHARRTFLPAGELPLLDAAPLGDGWVASYLDAGAAVLRLLDRAGVRQESIPLPGLGTVEWMETVREVGLLPKVQLLFAYTDFARPSQIFTWRPGDAHPLPATDTPALPFDPAHFTTRRAWATSADGTRVPLFLSQRREAPPLPRPTLLTAYGGMGVALTPRYSADVLAWMEMGGVFATVCARGGGELGAAWHQAAVGVHKQRTFDDLLAAARWLVDAGITSPARLGLWGVSNGGLTAGVCLTQAPELFGAVVIESGLLDMLDYHRLGQGAGWLAEYGNPEEATQRAALNAYSPLHNLQPSRVYPPTLLVTHSHDPRVGEEHSLRFAHALQSVQRGDAPVFLRVHPGSGHGPMGDGWAAERLTFLAEHLGIER